MSLLVIHTTVR